MNQHLHRYWYEFAGNDARVRPGVGVTAYDRADAERLIQQVVFDGEDIPRIAAVAEDIDISTLDQNHIMPNIFPPSFRGVWYPKITLGIE